jgi:hypothetical protein
MNPEILLDIKRIPLSGIFLFQIARVTDHSDQFAASSEPVFRHPAASLPAIRPTRFGVWPAMPY